ncbi:hypothetical protein OAM69_04705 [bacterium]|nr:hypothetical protein [bacterium]
MSVTRSCRGKAHWQQLVEHQSASGLSGAEFYRQHDVKYASFMSWRKQLKLQKNNPTPAPTNAFVELTAQLLLHLRLHSKKAQWLIQPYASSYHSVPALSCASAGKVNIKATRLPVAVHHSDRHAQIV